MAVGFRIDFLWYQVGHPDFLHSFFSTISYHLEDNIWGSKYPLLLNELYQGQLSWEHAASALEEAKQIKEQFKVFPPSDIIWDIDDLSKKPPWGDNNSPDITTLAEYFVTSDGRDLFEILFLALQDSIREKTNLEIANI